MARAKCKFRLTTMSRYNTSGVEITLTTEYDPKLCQEDEAFSQYTPSGKLTAQISNPHVEPMLELGRDYYVYIVPVENDDEMAEAVS